MQSGVDKTRLAQLLEQARRHIRAVEIEEEDAAGAILETRARDAFGVALRIGIDRPAQIDPGSWLPSWHR